MTDEQKRIRGYLQAQGAKLSPAEVVEKVRAAMTDLRRAASAVPPSRFEERSEPEEWSGNEVMAHVITAGRYFGDQILAVLDGRPRADLPRESPPLERHPAEEWSRILERDREALFDRVLSAPPEANLAETIEHRMFGSLNWRETLLFMRLHDLDHVGQLQKITAALA